MDDKKIIKKLQQKIFEFESSLEKQKNNYCSLKESEFLFSQMFEQSNISTCCYNPEGTIIKVNHEFCKMFGVEEKIIIGSCYNVFEDRALIDVGVVPLIQEIFYENKTNNWEIDYNIKKASDSTGTPTSKTGKIFLEVFGYPMLNRQGKLEYVVCQNYDITERKQIEESLHKSEAELKHTIEIVPGIIAKVNAHTGYFTQCNPALNSILGFSSEEFLARPFIELVHPNDRQSTINEVEKQLEGSPVVKFENRYICKDGAYKWLEWRATAADEKGLIYAAATDITERKQVEKALKKSHETLEGTVKKRTGELRDMNAALKVLLKKRDEDKKEMEEKISSNYKSLILPFIQKLKNSLTEKNQQNLMYIIESSLIEFLEPFSKKLSDPMVSLTPKEIQIASMIKEGLSNKEIAQTFNNSVRTITNHRQHIRRKLSLENKKINLRSYLSTL